MSALEDTIIEEIEERADFARVLGTAAERRALRRRLGLSTRDVAEITGMSARAIEYRETNDWKCLHGSIESPANLRYVEFLKTARQRLALRGVPE